MLAQRKPTGGQKTQLCAGGVRRGCQRIEKRTQASIEHGHLSGVGMHDAQQLIGIEVFGQPIVGHLDEPWRFGIVLVGKLPP